MLQPQQEISFYQDLNVNVTNLRVIFGPRVFILSGLTSVRVAENTPQRAGPAIFMALGIFVLLAAISELKDAVVSLNLVIALACISGSLIWFFLQKSTYSVKLGTYGGEVDGFTSVDANYITALAYAINQALIYRR
jgi:hypothetical protein